MAWLAILFGMAAPWLVGGFGVAAASAGSMAAAGLIWVGFHRAGWLGAGPVSPRQINHIIWRADGQWLLTNAQGRTFEAVLRCDTRVFADLAGVGPGIWLRWNAAGGIRSMILLRGDIAGVELRRLCLRLRIDRPQRLRRAPAVPVV